MTTRPQPDHPSSSSGMKAVGAAAVIVLLSVLAYAPAWRAGYVWDDDSILKNEVIRARDGLFKIWIHPSENRGEKHYWPLVYSTFWIERQSWGLNPRSSHAINVALHAANALILFFLLRRMKIRGAWLAAGIFTLHPVHVESTAWVIERKDLLSAFFYLLAFRAYLAFGSSRRAAAYFCALLCYILALLSKSIAVTFPAAIILWIAWDSAGRARTRSALIKDLAFLSPFFAVGFAIALADMAFVKLYDAPITKGIPLLERILWANRAVWLYLGKLVWPVPLDPIYPYWRLGFLAYAFPLCTLGGAVLCWRNRARWTSAPLFIGAFYMITLSPVLGLIQHGYMVVSLAADRFQYLASVGPVVLFAAVIERLLERFRGRWPAISPASQAALLACLGAATFRITGIYTDSVTFWRYSYRMNPQSWMAENNLGASLLQAGGEQEAIDLHTQALKLNPDLDLAHTGLGRILAKRGDLDAAIAHFHEAIKINGDSSEAHLALGLALIQKHDLPGAEAELSEAIRLGPNLADNYFGMAMFLQVAGRGSEAVAQYEKGLAIDPTYDEAQYNLGILYLGAGRSEEAISRLRRAIEINPAYPAAWTQLGLISAAAGNADEAIADYRRALEINPEFPEALNALGIELGERGDFHEAEKLIRQAIQEKADFAQAHNNLGILFARQGKMPEAAAEFSEALKLGYKEAADNLRRAAGNR